MEVFKGFQLPRETVVHITGCEVETPWFEYIVNSSFVYFGESLQQNADKSYNISLDSDCSSTWAGWCQIEALRTGNFHACDGKSCRLRGETLENDDQKEIPGRNSSYMEQCCKCINGDVRCNMGPCTSRQAAWINIIEIIVIWALAALVSILLVYQLKTRKLLCFSDKQNEGAESVNIQGEQQFSSDDLEVDLSSSSDSLSSSL